MCSHYQLSVPKQNSRDGLTIRTLDWLGWGFTSPLPKGNSMVFNTRSETILHRRNGNHT